MSHVLTSSVLSDEGVTTLLTAAIAAATAMGQPQCIVVVDQSGVTLGSFRMRGSRFQSLKSAAAKAQTAASIGAPSHSLPEHARVPLAVATHGGMTGLRGGLPIRVAGTLVGGIGVGSGSGEQDEQVARAALKAIGADLD
ncbi:heme-binding protein [Rhizobium sp. P40RR-XXII]|uniref:heme-binding protein n=1 Tax=unclassified Rhizobium TaxID=2613769 RepID=UPI001456D0D2|nr:MULTISPECIES: heme-binding protein [unclassified Rhizobium]NLR89280.1 heme-binding protein [Rhizobium sp. P28RR-XV]NLS20142.1 heme-binding protein [Rhizobium sp. P40RR-XXII]